jgi:hypothetical protein
MSLSIWNQQHVIGHHVHTNMDGKDPDLYHFTFLSRRYNFYGFRVTEYQRLEAMHKYWAIGLVVRSMLTTFGPSLLWDPLGFVVNGGKFLGIVSGPATSWSLLRTVVHFLGRFLVVSVCFLQPALRYGIIMTEGKQASFFGWLARQWPRVHSSDISTHASSNDFTLFDTTYELFKMACFVIVPYAIHGIIFYVFSQVSHAQHECAHTPKLMNSTIITMNKDKKNRADEEDDDANGRNKEDKPCDVSREWTVHQVNSTVDWNVTSLIWLHLSNGLSHQTTHHLFPQVCL